MAEFARELPTTTVDRLGLEHPSDFDPPSQDDSLSRCGALAMKLTKLMN